MPRTLSIADAKAHFAEAVRRAEAGETLVLTRHGRPVARLAPVATRTPAGVAEIRESSSPYDATGGERVALPAAESRREELEQLLRESIWPRVPEQQVGKGPDRGERERILGYGSEGV